MPTSSARRGAVVAVSAHGCGACSTRRAPSVDGGDWRVAVGVEGRIWRIFLCFFAGGMCTRLNRTSASTRCPYTADSPARAFVRAVERRSMAELAIGRQQDECALPTDGGCEGSGLSGSAFQTKPSAHCGLARTAPAMRRSTKSNRRLGYGGGNPTSMIPRGGVVRGPRGEMSREQRA